MEWYYVWWPWLTSKCVARVCQHQLSFLYVAATRRLKPKSYVINRHEQSSAHRRTVVELSVRIMTGCVFDSHSSHSIFYFRASCTFFCATDKAIFFQCFDTADWLTERDQLSPEVLLSLEFLRGPGLTRPNKKSLKNTNRKPYTIYRMVPLSMTVSDLWPRFQGHDIFQHWISQKRHEIEP